MPQQQKEKYCRITPAAIDKVIRVAGHLFARHGYESVGIRLIAEESGMTMPSIFYHFGSKASLYEEVLEYKYQATVETVTQAIKSLHEPRERLEFLIGFYFDQLFRDRTFLLLVHRDIGDVVAKKPRPAFLEEYSYTFAAFCTILDAVMGKPIEQRAELIEVGKRICLL